MKGVKHLHQLAVLGWGSRNWYGWAQSRVYSEAFDQGWCCDKFAAVIALLSPRVQVGRNWSLARQYMQGEDLKGILPNVRASLRHWEKTGHIRGPKTSAFNRALLGDSTALVLDSWMAAALGVDPRKVTTKRNMAKALRRMLVVADKCQLSVAETQAAVWAGVQIKAGLTPALLGE